MLQVTECKKLLGRHDAQREEERYRSSVIGEPIEASTIRLLRSLFEHNVREDGEIKDERIRYTGILDLSLSENPSRK